MEKQLKHVIHLYEFTQKQINQKQLSILILQKLQPYLGGVKPSIKFRGKPHKYWAFFQVQPQLAQRLNNIKILDIGHQKIHVGRYYNDYQIFLSKLNQTITKEEVINYFKSFGQVIDVVITEPVDKRNQNFNHCYIKMKDQSIVDKIILEKSHKIKNIQIKVLRTFGQNQDKESDKKLFLKIQGPLNDIEQCQQKMINYLKKYGKIRERPRIQLISNQKYKMIIIFTNTKDASNALQDFSNCQLINQWKKKNIILTLNFFHSKQNKIFVSNLKQSNEKLIKQGFELFGQIDEIVVTKGKGNSFNAVIRYINQNDFKRALTCYYQQKKLWNLFNGKPFITIFMDKKEKRQYKQMIKKSNNSYQVNQQFRPNLFPIPGIPMGQPLMNGQQPFMSVPPPINNNVMLGQPMPSPNFPVNQLPNQMRFDPMKNKPQNIGY